MKEVEILKIVVLDGYTLNPGDLSWNGLKELYMTGHQLIRLPRGLVMLKLFLLIKHHLIEKHSKAFQILSM
jgi:hypothetical protein